MCRLYLSKPLCLPKTFFMLNQLWVELAGFLPPHRTSSPARKVLARRGLRRGFASIPSPCHRCRWHLESRMARIRCGRRCCTVPASSLGVSSIKNNLTESCALSFCCVELLYAVSVPIPRFSAADRRLLFCYFYHH